MAGSLAKDFQRLIGWEFRDRRRKRDLLDCSCLMVTFSWRFALKLRGRVCLTWGWPEVPESSFLWMGLHIDLSDRYHLALFYNDNSLPTLSESYVVSEVPHRSLILYIWRWQLFSWFEPCGLLVWAERTISLLSSYLPYWPIRSMILSGKNWSE